MSKLINRGVNEINNKQYDGNNEYDSNNDYDSNNEYDSTNDYDSTNEYEMKRNKYRRRNSRNKDNDKIYNWVSETITILLRRYGSKEKNFTEKKVKELLLSNKHPTMVSIKRSLNDTLSKWDKDKSEENDYALLYSNKENMFPENHMKGLFKILEVEPQEEREMDELEEEYKRLNEEEKRLFNDISDKNRTILENIIGDVPKPCSLIKNKPIMKGGSHSDSRDDNRRRSRSQSRSKSRSQSRSSSRNQASKKIFTSSNVAIISHQYGSPIANDCLSIVTSSVASKSSIVLPEIPSFDGLSSDEAMERMIQLIEETNSFKYLRGIISNVFKDNMYGNRFYIPSMTLLTNSSSRNLYAKNLQRLERNKLNEATLSSFEVIEDILQIITKCFYFISVTYFGIPHMGNAIDIVWDNVSGEVINWLSTGNLSMGPMTFKMLMGGIAIVIGFCYRWGTKEISQTSMKHMTKEAFGYIIDNLFIYGMALYNYLEALHFASMYGVYKTTNGCCYYGAYFLRRVYEYMRLKLQLDEKIKNSTNNLPGLTIFTSSSCDSGDASSHSTISRHKGGYKKTKNNKRNNKGNKINNKGNKGNGKKSINRR